MLFRSMTKPVLLTDGIYQTRVLGALDGIFVTTPKQLMNMWSGAIIKTDYAPRPDWPGVSFGFKAFNIAFGVRLYEKLSRAEMDERVEWALNKAALWNEVKDKLNQSGLSLSGGQQQRLCIARGVAVKPSILLLDEPTSALDPISTAKVEELVHELKKDYTIAIVTHNMQQAARVSDFTAYMYLGEMVEFGKTDELFIKPKRKETEDYITGRFG